MSVFFPVNTEGNRTRHSRESGNPNPRMEPVPVNTEGN